MMRSLYSGITGLKNHQTRMDVIGNNIANVNTVGYKTSRVVFQDIYSQTLQSASSPQGANGGTNPKQIGLGVTLAAIDVLFSSSASQYTGETLDLALEGDGFFVIRTGNGEGDISYTRAGNFKLSSSGALVTSGGQFVQCYTSYYQLGTIGKTQEQNWSGKATTNTQNLIFNGESTATNSITQTPSGAYNFKVDDQGNLTVEKNGRVMEPQPAVNLFSYDTSTPPVRSAVNLATATTLAPGAYEFEIEGLGTFGFDVKAGQNIDLTANGNTGTLKNMFIEFEAILNNTELTVKNNDQFVADRSQFGDMVIDETLYYDVAVDPNGAINAIMKYDGYIPGTNIFAAQGEVVTLGFAGIATFINPGGLEKVGSNMYRESSNSGRPQYKTANVDGAGKINPGSLEMSNVDLASEFTDLIVTQRGFQANSRTITTSDQMLEELVNLKR